jgi:phosphatidate phosphatase PAH1
MVDPQPVSAPAPEKMTKPSASSEPVAQTQTASAQQLVNEDVLKQPVPAQDSLAKEEVSKLNDIHRQLQDQETTLKAQHADADQLIKLKEEQVKLLEAQVKQQ